LVEKPLEKLSLQRTRRRWKDFIIRDVRGMGCGK
jgi:hypothetical protein